MSVEQLHLDSGYSFINFLIVRTKESYCDFLAASFVLWLHSATWLIEMWLLFFIFLRQFYAHTTYTKLFPFNFCTASILEKLLSS